MSVPSISIQNRHGVSMLIDEENLRLLTQHKDGYWVFVVDRGYASIRQTKKLGGDGQKVFVHRLIVEASGGLEVDHINRNNLDNRKENLRLCTVSQQRMKRTARGLSQFRGVSKSRNKWQALIWIDGVNIHLGTFNTELEAALAYDASLRLQNCEFRTLNFPDEETNA